MLFCPLCSGSGGNASYLRGESGGLLVDAGVNCKKLTALLNLIDVEPASLSGILITHEHSDHIAGVGVFARKYHVPVYADEPCMARLLPAVGGLPPELMRVFEPDRDFFIRSLRVLPFSTPHDCAHPVGYAFSEGNKKISVMTDIGHVTERMLEAVADSDLILLEANHDVDMLRAGSYPYPLKMRILGGSGHLCNEDAGRVLVKLHDRGVRNAILAHLSRENNTPELALVTVRTVLEDAGISGDMFITVAKREEPTGLFEV